MKNVYFIMLSCIVILNLFLYPSCKKTKKGIELNSTDVTADLNKNTTEKKTRQEIDENTVEYNLDNIKIYLIDNCCIYKEPDQNSEVILENESIKYVLSNCKRFHYDKDIDNTTLWFRILLENNNIGWVESKNIIIINRAEFKNIYYGIIETIEIKFRGMNITPVDTNIFYNRDLVAFNDQKILRHVFINYSSDIISDIRLNHELSDFFGLDLIQIDFMYDYAGDAPHFHQVSCLYKIGDDGIIADYCMFYWWIALEGQDQPQIRLTEFKKYEKGLFLKYSFDNIFVDLPPVGSGTISVYYDFNTEKKYFITKKIDSEIILKDNEKTQLSENYIKKIVNIPIF